MTDIRAAVFDLYGTLVDVDSVVDLCDRRFPGKGQALSALWRQKQLEYTWLRSLMGRYTAFEHATEQALTYCAASLGLEFDAALHRELCNAYFDLRPHGDAPPGLKLLRQRDIPLAVLSNGSKRSIEAVVTNAGLSEHFTHLLSVEDLQVFKPDMRVYELAERTLGVPRGSTLFVSSNGWDVTGATAFGFNTCWVNRSGGPFEQMDERPTWTVSRLDEIDSLAL